MISGLKKLFTSSEVVEDISSGIDKSIYTTEEKVDNFHKLLELYTPFKVAQRILMIIMCVPYATAWFSTFIASFFIDTSKLIIILDGNMGTVVFTIILFYFGGGAVEGALSKFKGTKTNGRQ